MRDPESAFAQELARLKEANQRSDPAALRGKAVDALAQHLEGGDKLSIDAAKAVLSHVEPPKEDRASADTVSPPVPEGPNSTDFAGTRVPLPNRVTFSSSWTGSSS